MNRQSVLAKDVDVDALDAGLVELQFDDVDAGILEVCTLRAAGGCVAWVSRVPCVLRVCVIIWLKAKRAS